MWLQTTLRRGDFYIGHTSIASGFSCSTTGADTLIVNDYYVWNYDTLFTSGNYIDTLANQTGCDSITTLHLTVNSTVGISELASTSGINIYPNPNNGKFNIHFNATTVEPTRVRIINVLGKEVYNKTLSSSNTIDISETENGIYFIIVSTKDKTTVWRIIKQD